MSHKGFKALVATTTTILIIRKSSVFKIALKTAMVEVRQIFRGAIFRGAKFTTVPPKCLALVNVTLDGCEIQNIILRDAGGGRRVVEVGESFLFNPSYGFEDEN